MLLDCIIRMLIGYRDWIILILMFLVFDQKNTIKYHGLCWHCKVHLNNLNNVYSSNYATPRRYSRTCKTIYRACVFALCEILKNRFLAVFETYLCLLAVFCFFIRFLSPWNIPHFHFYYISILYANWKWKTKNKEQLASLCTDVV